MTLAGFLLLVLTAGCMAVANVLMKNGIVQAVRRFLSWSHGQHAKRVTVVTQAATLPPSAFTNAMASSPLRCNCGITAGFHDETEGNVVAFTSAQGYNKHGC
jgi:hypothetical protein